MANEVYVKVGDTYQLVDLDVAIQNMAPFANEAVLQMARGKIPGYTLARRFAVSTAITATSTDIWTLPTNKVLPTLANRLSLVSTSVLDSASGTGCQSVEVYGLDGDYNEITETVPLSGLQVSQSQKSFLRVLRLIVSGVGSGLVNAGNITASIGGFAQAYMVSGEGQAYMSHFTVPDGKTMHLKNLHANVGKGIDARVTLFLRPFGKGLRQSVHIDVFQDLEPLELDYSVTLTERTDLVVRATTSGNGVVRVNAGYVYILVSKEVS